MDLLLVGLTASSQIVASRYESNGLPPKKARGHACLSIISGTIHTPNLVYLLAQKVKTRRLLGKAIPVGLPDLAFVSHRRLSRKPLTTEAKWPLWFHPDR